MDTIDHCIGLSCQRSQRTPGPHMHPHTVIGKHTFVLVSSVMLFNSYGTRGKGWKMKAEEKEGPPRVNNVAEVTFHCILVTDLAKMWRLRCNWAYTMIVTALVCVGYTTPFSTLHQFITYSHENGTVTEQVPPTGQTGCDVIACPEFYCAVAGTWRV